MSALERLRGAFAADAANTRKLSESNAMDSALADLGRNAAKFGNATVSRDEQLAVSTRFWDTRAIQGFRDARLLSYAVGLPRQRDKPAILDDPERMSALLNGLDGWREQPRYFRRCVHGLLSTYFAVDGAGAGVNELVHEGWQQLRTYIADRLSDLGDAEHAPDWVAAIREHPEILTDNPFARLGHIAFNGSNDDLRVTLDRLGVDSSSWFVRELFMARLAAACSLTDQEFASWLPRLLADVRDNPVLHSRGLACLLNRYCRVSSMPLHIELRDEAVRLWGNPWLPNNSARWGDVQPGTRTRVSDWLKLEFIESFFTLLAENGQGDPRRMAFWKRYVSEIDNVCFALGHDAHNSRNKDLKELRQKAQGLTTQLTDGPPSNNAFVMSMQGWLIVEFSGNANALYGYQQSSVPFDTARPVRSGKDKTNSLKSSSRRIYLRHADNVHGFDHWEQQFEAELAAKCGVMPAQSQARSDRKIQDSRRPAPPGAPPRQSIRGSEEQRPSMSEFPLKLPARADTADGAPHAWLQSSTRPSKSESSPDSDVLRDNSGTDSWDSIAFTDRAFVAFSIAFGLHPIDQRSRGGNLLVASHEATSDVAAVLARWGFQYKVGKGWWRQ